MPWRHAWRPPWAAGSVRRYSNVIQRNEVEAAARSAFPGQSILGMHQFPGETGPVVFRGQRDFVGSYRGPFGFVRILLGKVRFYERLSHLPVPRKLHFEPDRSKLGFSYAFFTYFPGLETAALLASV